MEDHIHHGSIGILLKILSNTISCFFFFYLQIDVHLAGEGGESESVSITAKLFVCGLLIIQRRFFFNNKKMKNTTFLWNVSSTELHQVSLLPTN